MHRSSGWALLAVLAGVSLAAARTATVKDRARLRAAPSAGADLLGWVPAGTTVEVLGETSGWREVQAPDGRGFLWGEHLAQAEVERQPAAEKADVQGRTGGTLLDEVRDLKAEVQALRQRPDPATATDLDRLREDLEHVITAQHDLARHADERSPTPFIPGDPPPDGALPLSPVLVAVGVVVGWTASRIFQRRRDRRQRNRLRL